MSNKSTKSTKAVKVTKATRTTTKAAKTTKATKKGLISQTKMAFVGKVARNATSATTSKGKSHQKVSASQLSKLTKTKVVPNVKKTTAKSKAIKQTSKLVEKANVMNMKVAVKKTVESASLGFLGIAPYELSKDEDYMNEKQKSHFRDILMQWKQALMEEVDRTVHHMKDAVNFADPNDRATQEEEFNFELRARDRERKLIWKIDEALMRLENDDYGYCDACGVEIGIRRLEARPTATLCIDCKTLDEIKEKQTRL